MPRLRIDDIHEAARRIRPHIRHTPVLRDDKLDALLGSDVFCKAEHLQEVGAFKARGACNAVLMLNQLEEASRGVVTHSSGNHAAALARAASLRGISAHIVMPSNSSPTKIENVRRYEGQITFCEPTLIARETTTAQVMADTGATFIHPYDDPRVIAGQGTAALELLDEVPALDVIITCVGGGGLLSGTLIATKALSPETRVWAAEPRGADDAYQSWKAGRFIPQSDPQTIADGLRTSLGELTYPIIAEQIDDILLAEEATIRDTVHWVLTELGWLVEPSGCVPLAALRDADRDLRRLRVGVILTGGNFDPNDYR